MATTASALATAPHARTSRAAREQARPRVAAPSARPRLTVVTRPDPRSSSVPFVVLCTLVIVGALAAVLMLNISMSDTSYRIGALQSESQELTIQKQALAEENERLGTPQELEVRATELGMVPAGTPAYIDLAEGTVIGDPQPAGGAAAAPEQPPVPAAGISDHSEIYHGMGNEGH